MKPIRHGFGRVPWWYGVAVATVVWAIGVMTLGIAPESAVTAPQILDPIVIGILVAWIAMPLCIFLDQRVHADDLVWNPATSLWVLTSFVWFINIVVGSAYCLRRYIAARGTAPSEKWSWVLIGTVVFWAASLAIDSSIPDDTFPNPLYDALAALLVVAWIAMPIAVLLDTVRVRGYTDWDPNTRGFVIGTAVPLLNIPVGVVYLYKRHQAFGHADSAPPFTLSSDDHQRDISRQGSPWFQRAVFIFGIYFLLTVGVVAVVPSISKGAYELLALVVWVPFGPFFAGCVYKDAGWRRVNGHRVGDHWWLYLLSGLIQGMAFWYLLRRATKSNRSRVHRGRNSNKDD